MLNISYTDSYKQNLSNKFNSLYSNLNAKLIFPLIIYKNEISNTLKSTGNINRFINCEVNNQMKKYKSTIILNNIKTNVPKQNYILENEPINIFNELCNKLGLLCIYQTKWTNNFVLTLQKLINGLENKYLININQITNSHSLSQQQIKYFKQYGLFENNNLIKKRTFEQMDSD